MVQPEVVLQLEGICDQAVRSPGHRPFCCHGGAGSQRLVHDGTVNRVAIDHGSIRCEYLPVEFRAEHCTLEILKVVVPVSHQDVLSCRGLEAKIWVLVVP